MLARRNHDLLKGELYLSDYASPYDDLMMYDAVFTWTSGKVEKVLLLADDDEEAVRLFRKLFLRKVLRHQRDAV